MEDSPHSAGVAIDSFRCCKVALDRGQDGILDGPSAYFCKHPPCQYTDDQAYKLVEQFIAEGKEGEPMFKRAVESLEKSLGPEHPDTVTAHRNWEICRGKIYGVSFN